MSITTIAINTCGKKNGGKTSFCVFFTSADVSGAEIIKAVPTGDTALYLEAIHLYCAEAIAVTIGEGQDGTGTSVKAAIIGPLVMAKSVSAVGVTPATQFNHHFKSPVKLTDALDLTIDGAAGTISGIAEGFSM